MKTIVESLSDPFWQVGGGILAACAIIFVLTVRSPEVRLSREKQGGLRTFVSCDSTHIDVQGAIGFLLMQTSDSSGNSDGTARLYQFTLQVQDQAWKIQTIGYCMADGCLDFTGWTAP